MNCFWFLNDSPQTNYFLNISEIILFYSVLKTVLVNFSVIKLSVFCCYCKKQEEIVFFCQWCKKGLNHSWSRKNISTRFKNHVRYQFTIICTIIFAYRPIAKFVWFIVCFMRCVVIQFNLLRKKKLPKLRNLYVRLTGWLTRWLNNSEKLWWFLEVNSRTIEVWVV